MRDREIARTPEREYEWRDTVLAWAKSAIDLVAAEAKYRKQCYVRYFSGRITDEKARERPEDTEERSAFDSLGAFLNETDKCQYSLAELEDRMNKEGKP